MSTTLELKGVGDAEEGHFWKELFFPAVERPRTAPGWAEEIVTIARTARNFVWPRRPRNAGYIVLPFVLALLPSMYFLSLVISASLPSCLTQAATALNSTVLLAGPPCEAAFEVLPWGGLVVGNAGGAVRWFTNPLFHAGPAHLVGVMAALSFLLFVLEPRYGFQHTLPVLFASIVGTDLFALWLGAPGEVIVGAGGAAYGLFGMLLADAALNPQWSLAPRVQGLMAAILVIVALARNIVQDGDNLHRLGGVFGGLGISLAALPRFASGDDSRQAFLLRYVIPGVLGGVMIGLEFLVLPLALMNRGKL